MYKFEKALIQKGFKLICGVDEVGRGCFAGPVVAGAVILPIDGLDFEVNDSKLLSAKKRQELDPKIKEAAVAWAVGEVSVEVIDQIGIAKACQQAFQKAVLGLSNKDISVSADFILMDAFLITDFKKYPPEKQQAIIKGDQQSASIAAASIIAKVYRDNLMDDLAKKYPEYGFEKHKGYGTLAHRQAIKKVGLSAEHRKSFKI